MGDIFKEQIIKKKMTSKDLFIFILLSLLVILPALIISGLLTISGLMGFSFLILLLAGYIVFNIFSRFSLEYEYSVTNDIIDIDVIYNKRKRKNSISFKIDKIEYLSLNVATPGENLGVAKKFAAQKGTHVILANIENKKTKILFDPNAEILEAIKRRLPSTKIRGDI